MKSKRTQVLFFDVGYTLVDETAVWAKRCEEQAKTAEAVKLQLSADDIYHEIENASIARMPQYRTFIDKYRIKYAAPYRHEFEKLYVDAPSVLEHLAEKYKLGVIANQADGLEKRLEDFGIRQYFTYIISSWDVQVMKPDTRIFEYALRVAGCPPEDATMIGDRLDNDIIPAKSLGMKTVWIKQGFGRLQKPLTIDEMPDYQIESLSKLTEILL